MLKFSILQTIALTLLLVSFVHAQDWLDKIIPAQTSRAEVEQLFGKTDKDDFLSAKYELKDGTLHIYYSSGFCSPERNGGWNVAKGVVTSVVFYPTKKRKLSFYKLDLTKFKKEREYGYIDVYTNDETGFLYEVEYGKVDSIYRDPPAKYDYLYCEQTNQNR